MEKLFWGCFLGCDYFVSELFMTSDNVNNEKLFYIEITSLHLDDTRYEQ